MSKTVKIKRGLDIKLKGKAKLTCENAVSSKTFALKPSDFQGLIPKLSVKVGDSVNVGTPLFFNKYKEQIKFCSPASGVVTAINRGELRRILEIVVESDGKFTSEKFEVSKNAALSAETIKETLLSSGLWPFVIQRPFGIVANPDSEPRDIFISTFDSSPLAPDYNFIFKGEEANFQKGIDIVSKLTNGSIYLGLQKNSQNSLFENCTGVEKNYFSGPHPAGNVGIQIHHIKPINKGEIVWTLSPQAVVFIGRLFANGALDFSKTVALTGSEVAEPRYFKTIVGASVSTIVNGNTLSKVEERIISGNVLTGTKIADNYLGFYDSQITVIPEGHEAETFGWATPGFNKYSPSFTFLSHLFPKKEYVLNANFHGGERAFVMTGQYDRVFPMDILPVYLIKAVITNDFDQMEQLGIYEVIEEDMALCEYVCTSKIEVQTILRNGINTVIKELS